MVRVIVARWWSMMMAVRIKLVSPLEKLPEARMPPGTRMHHTIILPRISLWIEGLHLQNNSNKDF